MRLSSNTVLLFLPLVSSLSIHYPAVRDAEGKSSQHTCTHRFWEWRSARDLVTCLQDLRSIVMSAFEGPQLILGESVILDVALIPAVTPSNVSTTITISNRNVTPDGFTRIAVVANNSFPGPLIKAYKDHTLEVNVVNVANETKLRTETSIHWHGIDQHKTNWADGVDYVTQCPIETGTSFTYTFDLPDPGTYWYHSHTHTQYCDGLRGPLIVYDPEDLYLKDYDVDDENTVVTIGDWSHSIPADRFYASTVINGLGRSLDPQTKEINTAPLAVINVEHGKRYRLRVLNIGCDPNYVFSIEGHNMTVIAADAVEHHPLLVDSIQIFSGQRYSVILHANAPLGNYWMWASPNNGAENVKEMVGGLNSAILRYVGAPGIDPVTPYVKPTNMLREADLRPIHIFGPDEIGLPGLDGADVSLNFTLDYDGKNFLVNNASFVNPPTPVLLQILSGIDPNQLLPSGSVYTLPLNKVIQITFPMVASHGNDVIFKSAPHPMHLHGHFFSVVRSAGETEYIWDNPPRRDVVSAGNSSDDSVTIRFKTDNAGPWILHCHIDFHLEGGLAAVLAAGTSSEMINDNKPPTQWQDLCAKHESVV